MAQFVLARARMRVPLSFRELSTHLGGQSVPTRDRPVLARVLTLAILGAAAACGGGMQTVDNDATVSDAGDSSSAMPDVGPADSPGSKDAPIDAPTDTLTDAPQDAPITTDAGQCGSLYLITPCCGGPALQCLPLPDGGGCPGGTQFSAACQNGPGCRLDPCKPAPPFCAALPASCTPGKECWGICPSGGSGYVDAKTMAVRCVCQ